MHRLYKKMFYHVEQIMCRNSILHTCNTDVTTEVNLMLQDQRKVINRDTWCKTSNIKNEHVSTVVSKSLPVILILFMLFIGCYNRFTEQVSNQSLSGFHHFCSTCFLWHPMCMLLSCSSQSHKLVQQRSCNVLSCLCDKACKRITGVCCKSSALCPGSRLLSVPL